MMCLHYNGLGVFPLGGKVLCEDQYMLTLFSGCPFPGVRCIYANLVNSEVYLKVPVS